jgi:uncharacterized protein (TIGR03083 family)
MTSADTLDLGAEYRAARGRIGSLVGALDESSLGLPVPACPGWSVHDVVAHLVAVAEDVLEGRLTKPPSDEETAAQVERRAGQPMAQLLDDWAERAPAFEELVTGVRIWPAMLDALSHEQDIRGAIGAPGARDVEGIRVGAEQLLGWLRPSAPIIVDVGDAIVEVAAKNGGDQAPEPLRLSTDRFEVFRLRLGRRSRRQVAALAWDGDPSVVLGELFTFGPAAADIVE